MARETAPAKSQEDREKSKRLGSLAALAPFLTPYKTLLTAALVALVATACISLILPLAVRRVVDTFEDGSGVLLNQYFAAAFGIVLAGLGVLYRFGPNMRGARGRWWPAAAWP